MYKVRVKGATQDGVVTVIAELPEDGVSVSVEQEWENPFKLEVNPAVQAGVQMLSGLLSRRTDGAISRKSAVWNHNLFYTYMGGSPLQLSIPMIFVAEKSVIEDIINPVKNLMKLSCPIESEPEKNSRWEKTNSFLQENLGSGLGGLLTPPPEVSISIGKFLRLRNCIITNVNTDFLAPLVSDSNFEGAPMRIPVTINIITRRIVTQSKVNDYFFQGDINSFENG